MSFQCPNCKRSLDWSADRCPSCRRDLRKDKENARKAGRVILLLLISPYLILMFLYGIIFKIFGRYKNQEFWKIIRKDWLIHISVIFSFGLLLYIQYFNNYLLKNKKTTTAQNVESIDKIDGINENANETNPTISAVSSIESPVVQMEHNYYDKLPISPNTLSKLDAHQIEMIILYIYARHQASFESLSAQRWADGQSWYKKIEGRTIHDAEKSFNYAAKSNVNMLTERWNEIQEEEGLPAVAVENSPLAGRAVSPDIENAIIAQTPSQVEMPDSKILNSEMIAQWDAIRIRNEINTIYAKYGVQFTNVELRRWAEKLPQYKPVMGRTFSDAEALFSEIDRENIKLLAARRDQIKRGN